MKAFVITLAVACLASTATLDAQILNRLPVPSTNSSINVDGSWRTVGRDRNGNTIYERRTRDVNGNILVQQSVRDRNGNLQIINSRTEVVNNNQNVNRGNGNCDYTRSTSTVGDIIFGRSSNVTCNDVGNRSDGGWYQVGRGPSNNSVYVRRTRDARGNLVIQRARRDRNGRFTIISTRYATDNDKEWNKTNKNYNKAMQKGDNGKHKGKR
jgi:hypothetical protein